MTAKHNFSEYLSTEYLKKFFVGLARILNIKSKMYRCFEYLLENCPWGLEFTVATF